MPPPPKFRSFEDVGRWAEEHEAQHRREEDARSHELTQAIAGATAHIDRVTAKQNEELAEQTKALREQGAALANVDLKLNAIGSHTMASAEELRLAREERIKRTAADEEKARIKKEAADAAEAAAATLARNRKERNTLLAIIVPIVLAIIGLIGMAIQSHH